MDPNKLWKILKDAQNGTFGSPSQEAGPVTWVGGAVLWYNPGRSDLWPGHCGCATGSFRVKPVLLRLLPIAGQMLGGVGGGPNWVMSEEVHWRDHSEVRRPPQPSDVVEASWQPEL